MPKRWLVTDRLEDDLVEQLLINRGVSFDDRVNFLRLLDIDGLFEAVLNITTKLKIDELNKAVNIIESAVAEKRSIIIHGDYDVDGICGTAIIYRALKKLGANVTAFIPDRFDDGYGLSLKSLAKLTAESGSQMPPLLITVDCGITSHKEVDAAKKCGMEVIITDHHSQGSIIPDSDALLWTDELSGAGVAWVLAQKLKEPSGDLPDLDLVALATVADLQPLIGPSRVLTKHGLTQLNQTANIGLKALIGVSGLEGKQIGTYEVGWVLAPRLNASGRLQHAKDSLDLLLTDNEKDAFDLAINLNTLNAERQQLVTRMLAEARRQYQESSSTSSVIILQSDTWHEGVIGLVAGKIKEEFYRPAVIIARGEKFSKGSARSIDGFNIVKSLRECSDYLLSVGGHAMAAGFTLANEKLTDFENELCRVAQNYLTEDLLTPLIKIDAEINFTDITQDLMNNLLAFEPFGVGNPQPVFVTKSVQIVDVRTVGVESRHLKLILRQTSQNNYSGKSFPAIGFDLGHFSQNIFSGDSLDIVYNINENNWNGNKCIQLIIKDLRTSQI